MRRERVPSSDRPPIQACHQSGRESGRRSGAFSQVTAHSDRNRGGTGQDGLRTSTFVFRHRAGNAVIFLALLVAAARLFNLQVPRAAGLRAQAATQLKVTDVEKAVRGSIVDRNMDKSLHHRGAGVDVPAAEDPQTARRSEAEVVIGARPGPAARADRQGPRGQAEQQARCPDTAEEAPQQRDIRLPGPCCRPRAGRCHHHEIPRDRRRTPGSAPVPRWRTGREHRRRHRLGRTRAARSRRLDGFIAFRYRRLHHLRPRLGRRGHPRQLSQQA